MKYLTLLLFFVTAQAVAQVQDTSAYEIQRLKVNALLAERSAKFGQYDVSLNARTGIFGFQTKKDVRNSNEILRQIAINDNEIFKELKVLMDYKDVQAQQIQDDASTNSSRLQLYRTTIKRFQDQNEKLAAENKSLRLKNNIKDCFIAFLLLGIIACSYIFYKKFKKLQLK